MADNKTYYYLKLKEDFFDTQDMKLLQGMKDGYMYSDILLKLNLLSLRQEGRLMYRGIIPYTPEMVATITHHQVGTVEKAMKVLNEMGFIEVLDNGAIYMMDIQNFIGQSSSEADRKRTYRNTINAEKSRILEEKAGQMSGHLSEVSGQIEDKNPPENRDKRIEIREQSIEFIDKSIEEYKDLKCIDNSTLAQSSSEQSEPAEEPLIKLILNTGEEYPLFQSDLEEYQATYPAVDVLQHFRQMRQWCKDYPAKRKTKKGIRRFINSWLAREQDKYHPSGPVNSNRILNRVNEVDKWNF